MPERVCFRNTSTGLRSLIAVPSFSIQPAATGWVTFSSFKSGVWRIRRPRAAVCAILLDRGANASAFLISVDGSLYEAPITYFSASGAWNLSPGYASDSYPFLTRAITRGCQECHSSGLQPTSSTQNGCASPRFSKVKWGVNAVMVRGRPT